MVASGDDDDDDITGGGENRPPCTELDVVYIADVRRRGECSDAWQQGMASAPFKRWFSSSVPLR